MPRARTRPRIGARTSALPGDADLDALVAPGLTQDAAILEFDVIPVGNTMSVRFVFASEEYNEFVGSDFNDVIAVYVNGVNCANYNGLPGERQHDQQGSQRGAVRRQRGRHSRTRSSTGSRCRSIASRR